MPPIHAVQWSPDGDALRIIDQRLLPARYEERDLRDVEDVRGAIATLAVRGAPAIGVAAAIGLASSLMPYASEHRSLFEQRLTTHAHRIRSARPTAVNLAWAIDRMLARAAIVLSEVDASASRVIAALRDEATAILGEDRDSCRRIGEHGATLLREGSRVLTHCNAGALATAGIGTALAPVYVAAERGLRVSVLADETRPLLQGSRLTAWELQRAGIDVTVIADNMAATMMRLGRVDVCIVGADRIAANGDVANKIGTYAVALAARHHGIPFYVAAPSSTFDAATPTGDDIVIEERDSAELTHLADQRLAPERVSTHNPAFDITPYNLVTAYIDEHGVHPTLNAIQSSHGRADEVDARRSTLDAHAIHRP